MELINKKIKNIRAWSGKTQQDFADSIDISRSTLALIETGKAVPTYGMLRQISSIYKVLSTYFFEDETEDISKFVKDNDNDLKPNNDSTHFSLSKKWPEFKSSSLNRFESRISQTFELLKQSKKILDIRLKKEINSNYKAIAEAQNVLDEAYASVDVLHNVFINYIASPPDPADISYYYIDQEDSYELELPDKIDYKKYKEETIIYYEKLLPFVSSISNLKSQIDQFLKEVEKIDDYGIIE